MGMGMKPNKMPGTYKTRRNKEGRRKSKEGT